MNHTEESRAKIVARIREISKGSGDPKSKRDSLNFLIGELKKVTGYTDPHEYPVDKVAGGWKQIYTDQTYPIPSFLKMDPDSIYQIVSKENHYWNVSNLDVFGIFPTVGCLRGKYEGVPGEPSVRVEFTRNGFRLGHLPGFSNVVDYADTLEDGSRWVLSIGSGAAPSGPVGISGKLTSIYVDDEIRIDGGTQFPFTDGSGKVLVEGFTGTLFILEKVESF